MRAVWSDETMVQRWLDVEAALARGEARLGIIPAAHAEEITRRARAELLDLGRDESASSITPDTRLCRSSACSRACATPPAEMVDRMTPPADASMPPR
jgi:3-carboxy-cis,cis-muconate cycloisomerase